MEVYEDLENTQIEAVTLTGIMRTIFDSCDVDKTDFVQVSKLINIIKPFFQLENWGALNELHRTLDPEGKDIFVNSDRFYVVMGQWTKKMELASAQEQDFDRLDEELALAHSTPKSRYRCSRYKQPEADNSEKIKELEYQMQKMFDELDETRQQLTENEEINEIFQGDLRRLKQKLLAEQHINENLQKGIQDNEKLRQDLIDSKTNVQELKKTVSRLRQDCLCYESKLDKIENEKTTVEKRLETVIKQKNYCLNELYILGTQLKDKEDVLNKLTKSYNKLQHSFSEQQKCIDELQEENNVLGYKNTTFEKALKSQNCSNNINMMPDNIEFKDYSIEALEKIEIKNQTLHDEISKLNVPNENYETLFESHSELTIENDELGLENNKLSVKELNEELAKTKENLANVIKAKSDTIQVLQDKNMQLEQTNKNQIEELNNTKKDLKDTTEKLEEKNNVVQSNTKLIEELNQAKDVFEIDKQQLDNELSDANKNLLLLEEKFILVNKEKQMLHNQLDEDKALIDNFEDLKKNYTLSELKLKYLTEELTSLQKLYVEVQTENNLNKQERYNLKQKLDELQAEKLMVAKKEYSRLQTVVTGLAEKLEKEKTKNQQLEIRLSSMNESNENNTENRAVYNEVQEISGLQAHGRILTKFTTDRRDSPSLGINDTNLPTKEKLSNASNSFLEKYSLDVNRSQDFSLDGGIAGKNLTQKEEKKKMTDSNEKYSCQYNNILMLVRDASSSLRDHQCTGNAETILPAYNLIKDIKTQLNNLIQNTNQVDALMEKEKKKITDSNEKYRCQVSNILMLVRDASSSLRDHQCTGNAETILPTYNLIEEIKTQLKNWNTNQIDALICENPTEAKQKRLKWSTNKQVEEYIPKKGSKFCRWIMLGIIIIFAMALALAIMLGFNCLCRASAPKNVLCPLDAIIEFKYNRKPI